MKRILQLLVFLSVTVGLSQIGTMGEQPMSFLLSNMASRNMEYESANGTPYLNEAFLPVKINEEKKTYLIRLNIVDDNIEIKMKDGKNYLLILDKDMIIRFVDGSSKHLETNTFIDEEGKVIKSFFEVVQATKDYTLYLKKRKTFVPEKRAEIYSEAVPAHFSDIKTTYFIAGLKAQKTALTEIPLRKKKFLIPFGRQSKTIEKYIKREKLDHKELEDLIQIMDYYFSKNK